MGIGEGQPRDIVERDIRSMEPDVIVGQGTSSDDGPQPLGLDRIVPTFERKRAAEPYITLAKEYGVPFIFSCGYSGCGSDPGFEASLREVDAIARDNHLKLRVAVISGEVNKEYIKAKLAEGVEMKCCFPEYLFPELDYWPLRIPKYLSPKDVDNSKRIVAQMGPEPIIKALDENVDGVLTGRALDVGLYMAMPLKLGFDKGLAAHMAKIIECGSVCTEPIPIKPPKIPGGDVLATLRKDHFLVTTTDLGRRCTIKSVAAHAFYERVDISKERNPGGYLDLSEAKYEQVDERTVRAWGGKWVEEPYTVKIEGVKSIGYRFITFSAARDPVLIKNIDYVLDECRTRVRDTYARHGKYSKKDYRIDFTVYGRNGVLGEYEPNPETMPKEIVLASSVIAKTPDLARAISAALGGALAFADFPGRTTTAGNFAYHLPDQLTADKDAEEAYVYNIWHLMPLDNPCEPFRMKIVEFPRSKVNTFLE